MYLPNDPNLAKTLKEENLRYISDKTPGFFRQRVGKNFKYYDLNGNRIKNKKVIERIEELVIPPAWDQVWISPKENTHIQVTGIDDRGRKQYIYHPDWIKIGQENKFSKMIDFGLSLPKIRQKVRFDLKIKRLEKRKILATIIWLLEHTFIRIGNEEYSKENKSFGLTTLRNRHVRVNKSSVKFNFRGKSGVEHIIEVYQPTVVNTIRHCIELPGYELFQYIDEAGNRHVIDSADVNEFLKDVTKDDFSAKDFRTWGASNLSANNFYKLGEPEDDKSLKQNIIATVKKVASHLNNTVNVCKNYYIHPTVIQTYQNKTLIPHFDTLPKSKSAARGLSWDEYGLIKLLQKYPSFS